MRLLMEYAWTCFYFFGILSLSRHLHLHLHRLHSSLKVIQKGGADSFLKCFPCLQVQHLCIIWTLTFLYTFLQYHSFGRKIILRISFNLLQFFWDSWALKGNNFYFETSELLEEKQFIKLPKEEPAAVKRKVEICARGLHLQGISSFHKMWQLFNIFHFNTIQDAIAQPSVKGVEIWKSFPRRRLWGATKKLGGIVDTSSRFGLPSLLWGTFGHNCSCKFKVRYFNQVLIVFCFSINIVVNTMIWWIWGGSIEPVWQVGSKEPPHL